MRYQRAELPLKLDGLATARAFFAGCIADSDPTRESLWVAHLDDEANCVHLTRHAGDESGTDFPLRAIIAAAALHHSPPRPVAGPLVPTAEPRFEAEGLWRVAEPA